MKQKNKSRLFFGQKMKSSFSLKQLLNFLLARQIVGLLWLILLVQRHLKKLFRKLKKLQQEENKLIRLKKKKLSSNSCKLKWMSKYKCRRKKSRLKKLLLMKKRNSIKLTMVGHLLSKNKWSKVWKIYPLLFLLKSVGQRLLNLWTVRHQKIVMRDLSKLLQNLNNNKLSEENKQIKVYWRG